MLIKEINAVHVRVPLDVPYVYARGTMTAFETVIVRLLTDDGTVGYGESAPLFRSPSGDARSVAQTLNGPVAQNLIGCDPFDVEVIINRILGVSRENLDVVAGVDLALWDLMGKNLAQPVYRLLGGLCQDPIAVDYTISASHPKSMADVALRVHREGFQGVVVKVTGNQIEEDVERVSSVREALPSNCTVRVDCNGVYSRDSALEFLKKIVGLDIEFVEQPVPADDVEGLKRCREIGIPISVDESLKTLHNALTLVSQEACDVMNIKVPNVGGLFLAKRIAAIASSAGLPIVVGGRTALELSRCASRHFAASTCAAKGRKHEGPGPASQALSDDVVAQRTTREMAGRAGGHVKVEKSPGLGIEIVWEKVKCYAVSSETTAR